jgi:hypothetical protein
MQDSKETAWSSRFGKDVDLENGASDAGDAAKAGHDRDTDGWQQYRRWISKAPAPTRRRGGVDPSLYTWKGYRNGTEHVKRNWNDNSS